MKKTTFILVCAAIATFHFSLNATPVKDVPKEEPKPDKIKEEKAKFEGTWVPVKLLAKGENILELPLSLKFTFLGEKLIVSIAMPAGNQPAGNQTLDEEVTWTIDPQKNPKTITMTSNRDQKTIVGIYKWEGDNLILCSSDKGNDKVPTEFTSTKDNQQDLGVFKREKANNEKK